MSYCTWDTETTTKTTFKRKANPFDPDNWVVTHGFKHKGGAVVEERFGKDRPKSAWLYPALHNEKGERIKLLIGFNIKFDLLHALQDPDNLAMWMDYVAHGGNVWDCQLAEYLLNGMKQSEHMLSLDEVAPRYGGNVKVDEVKALWNAGVSTDDIEPDLLSRYLCGGKDEHGVFQLGDIENTERIALQQIERARQAGQLNSILLNMGALLFTVEAERNGMYVDKQRGLELAAALKIKLAEATAAIAQYLPADLPFDFNWNSPYQKSALFFGGTVQYDCRQYDLKGGENTWTPPPEAGSSAYVYAQRDATAWLLNNGDTTFCDPFDAPNTADYATFKGGKNAGEFKTKKVKVDDYTKPKSRIVKRDYTFRGYTKPKKSWEGATPGVYSTSADVIEELANSGVPFLKVYSELIGMSKDLGTYYIKTDDEGKESGMLTLVDGMGLIHHKLNMCSTVTARLSSSDPNLQNIPKGNKSDVKTLFVSRFKNGKIVQSDFKSLEVYVQAILTACKQLIADLKANIDLHCVRLAAKEHMDYAEVVKLCKGWKETTADGTVIEHAAVKEWDYKRTDAKTFSFQRAYGAGVKKISASTGIPEEEVQALADAEDARYPEIPEYYNDITYAIKQSRKSLRTIPHPEFPGVICHIGEGSFRTPDGKLYCYVEQPSPEYLVKKGVTASFSPTEIKNYVVQGMGGEFAKAAMWLSVRAFYKRRNFDGNALLVNQVHDAVYVDAADGYVTQAAALLHACMEAASDFMEFWCKIKVLVPVPSDTNAGDSMMDEEEIPGLKELAASLRTELRQEYMGGYVPSFLT
jgi:DNA polymerase-1